jgi:pimeloyl-ACP methyl ester carboxylesterase
VLCNEKGAAPRSPGGKKKAMTAPTPPALIRPFTVSIPDSEIDDAKQRLARTRWPDRETVGDWSQGVRLENARSLAGYWERGYDWRRLESRLNRFPQFLTEIDGLDIHFIHVRSVQPGALPLILSHGWPGSIVDFLELIGPLTDPVAHGGDAADAFDVVVPSLPGFGFSGKPAQTGWTVDRTARAWAELMKRLGYTHWAAQGGDWGAVVTTALGAMQPEGLAGIHLNTPYAFPAQIPDTLSPEQRYAVETLARYNGELGGSSHLQGTKPQTIGYALADSPAGQAAWIYEKFQSKTDNHGLAEDALSMDAMLDVISLYWFTNSAASSARIYWENRSATFAGPKLMLPVAVTVFPKDIPRLPRSWIEDTYSNLIHYGEAPAGGHFAALEQPDILVSEIRAGLRALRRPAAEAVLAAAAKNSRDD